MTEIELRAVDCIEGMDAMPAGLVDIMVTSPPYNLGIKYRKYNDSQKHAFYINWTRQWLAAARRVLAPGGSLFLNLGACPRKPLLPYEIVLVARDMFILQNTFHWIKSLSIDMKDGSVLSVGHFKPINSKRYVNDCHEFVFHYTKTGNVALNRLALGVPYADQSNVKRWKHTGGQNKRCRGNVWYIPYPTIVSRDKQRPHPATFPPKLAENAIRLHAAQRPIDKMTVLDPFVGIGNTILGAMEAGASRAVGFDCDDYYVNEARKRCSIPSP
jgi:site-specific DNA-methyltransferase (adenine-specific)